MTKQEARFRADKIVADCIGSQDLVHEVTANALLSLEREVASRCAAFAEACGQGSDAAELIRREFDLTSDLEPDLFRAMFHPDPAIGRRAKELWDRAHANDPQPKEPPHCDECFEGCPKCDPALMTGQPK